MEAQTRDQDLTNRREQHQTKVNLITSNNGTPECHINTYLDPKKKKFNKNNVRPAKKNMVTITKH